MEAGETPVQFIEKPQERGIFRYFKKDQNILPQESSPELIQRRSKIINSVLQNGLRSGVNLAQDGTSVFGSVDGSKNDIVFGRTMPLLPNPKFEKNAFFQSLYMGGDSVFPVMTERSDYDRMVYHNMKLTEELRKEFESQMGSNFLVICKNNLIHRPPMPKGVQPEQFYNLVFPKNIWEEYSKSAERRAISYPVKVVPYVKKQIMSIRGQLLVPDYEDAIKESLKELQEPIWFSAARLPTLDDLQRSSPAA